MERGRVAAIPFFGDLPEDALAAVAGAASELEIEAGQRLTDEGHIGHSLFAIESGTADVVMEGTKVGTVEAGDVIGEIAVLASPPDPFARPEVAQGGVRTATVVATSPMRVIALFKRDVWALDRQAPGVTERLRALVEKHRAQDAQRGLPGVAPRREA